MTDQTKPDEKKPTTPATEEQKPTETPAPAADLAVGAAPVAPAAPAAVFEKTGDPALDIALDFFGKAGFKPDSEAIKLAEKGDFSLLEAELASKGKAGWEQFVGIAKQAHTRETEKAKTKREQTKAAVLSVVGDEETWGKVKEWADKNGTPEEHAEINSAFALGGRVAKAMALYLKTGYERATGAPAPEKDAPVSNGRSHIRSTEGGPLSPAEFSKAIAALATSKLNPREREAQRNALRARRAAFKG